MVEESGLCLAPRNDMAELQNAYERAGRVHIRGVLKQLSADAIYGCLADQPQWNLVYNKGGEHVDMDATAVSKWPRAKRKKLEKAIHLLARDAFQYHYMAIPIYDVYHKELLPGHFLNKVFEFVNDATMLDAGDEREGQKRLVEKRAKGCVPATPPPVRKPLCPTSPRIAAHP